MKTFKQFNEEAQYHLDEVDRNMMGLGTGLNIAANVGKFAFNNLVKKPVVSTAKKVYGTYKGIRNFVKNRPNTTKFEIDQLNRDTFPTKETK